MQQKKKIKLLVLIPTLQCGGSEKYVSMLCNNIDATAFDVTLIVVNNEKQFYHISNTAVEVIDLKTKKVRNALFAIRKIINNKRPDLIFSAASHINLMMAMFQWSFSGKIKIVAREASLVSSNIKDAKLPGIYKVLAKRYYKRLDHIICQSAAMQKDLVNNFAVAENKTTVVHNPVEAGTVIPVTGNKLYKFITVARLSAEKGIDRIIKALSLVDLPYQYYIIGDGNEKVSLQQIVNASGLNDKIFFTGLKEIPFSGMQDADLFLFGSYYEGFPNAVLEAIACGIPVVTFDMPGGIKEIITDGINGLLVKDDEFKSFASAVEKALSMPFNRKQVSEQALQKFSIPKIIKKVEEVLSDLVK